MRRDLLSTPFFVVREFDIAPGEARPTMLLVPPLSGHFPVLLRDMVVDLLPDVRVALLDWANVRHVPLRHGTFGFGHNVAAVQDAVLQAGPATTVVALCQGGAPALAAVADLSARRPESAPERLVIVAAPIDPLANPTRVVDLIRSFGAAWYRTVPLGRVSYGFAGVGRRVYPAAHQLAGLRAYLARHAAPEDELARKMGPEDDGACPARFPFADLYKSLMDIDARHFAENIETVFLRRDLARNRLRLGGRDVDLGAITRTALLTIEGADDDIAAPGQTSAALELSSGLPSHLRESVVVPEVGHFGLFHGDTWRAHVLPLLRARWDGGGSGRSG